MPKPKKFRFAAKKALLTYSSCPLSKEDWAFEFHLYHWDHIKRYLVSQEHHKDGSLHLHAVVEFTRKYQSINKRCFDVSGYHPGIKAVAHGRANDRAVYKYLLKEDPNPLGDWSAEDIFMIAAMSKTKTEQELFDLAVEEYGSRVAFGYINMNNFIKRCAKPPVPKPFDPKYKRDTFKSVSVIEAWFEQFVLLDNPPTRRTVLVVYGESQFGKTRYIKSFGPNVYMGEGWNLHKYNRKIDGAKYLIFDDWNQWDNNQMPKKGWTQSVRIEQTDKYLHKFTCKPLPLVWLQNDYPAWATHNYWKKNSLLVHVTEPLYLVHD